MKKLIILSMMTVFFLSLSTGPVFAGSKERYRWQGAAIGIGAAILGSAIINSYKSEPVRVIEHETHYYSYPPPRCQRSCEPRRVWVPPVNEQVWNPGHYDQYGRWISGQYILLERAPGYWVEERVLCDRR